MTGPVFLLGAGASVEAGLPLARTITQQMLVEFSEARDPAVSAALNYVVGSILAFDSRAGARPDLLPDIERVVSAVELLSKREALEVAPFISWDDAVSGLEAKRASTSSVRTDLQRALTGRTAGSQRENSLDAPAVVRAIEGMIRSSGTTKRDVFGDLYRGIVKALDQVLRLEPDSPLGYLQPLVAMGASVPLTVATLNYDLIVETAAQASGIACSDGVQRWATDSTLKWGARGVRLMKLHGSLSWQRLNTRTRTDGPVMPTETVAARFEGGGDSPFLVFGRREKLRAQGPFLQLLEAFRSALTRCYVLVVIGYGFADEHVNELIAQWLNHDDKRQLVVVDPEFPVARGMWSDDVRELLVQGLNGVSTPRPHPRLRILRCTAGTFLAGMGSDPFGYAVAHGTTT